MSYWHDTYQVSERRACRVARLAVSTFRYESMQEPKTALRQRIREIAQTRVRYGYRKIRVLLNREGWKVGKKLVYRLYKEEGLTLLHKPRRKRRAAMHRRERFRPTAPNQVWGLDFIANQLADGRRFRALIVLDVFTRRKSGHRSGTENARGRRSGCVESDSAEERRTKAHLLRQRNGVHEPDYRSLGVSQPGADRLLPTGEADRQRTCGIVQRHAASRVFGCMLVRVFDRGQASYRGLEAGIL